MLVLEQVPVHTDTKVWGTGLVINPGTFVAGICLAVTQLEDRVVLILQVDAQRCLILTVVAHHQLHRTDDIYAYCHAPEQRDGIFGYSIHLLLLILGMGRTPTHQQQEYHCREKLSGGCRNRYRNALWMHHNLPLFC